MAKLVELQSSFDRGVVRDTPRNELPRDAVYGCLNMLPDIGAPLRRRGAWEYASPDIDPTADSDLAQGGIYAQFEAGALNLACMLKILGADKLVSFTASTVTSIGDIFPMAQNPVMHRDLVIFPAADGATTPKSYDRTTLGNLAGSPPQAIYATVHKDFTVLANTDAEPQRIYFSAAGNPASWTTASRYVDSTLPITGGIRSLRGNILIFSSGLTERLRGSTPPPGGDMILEPLANVGCVDARSIVSWGEFVVWADTAGIYITNGSTWDDLSALCGMKSWWLANASVVTTARTFSAGMIGNYYLITVSEGKDADLTENFTVMIDLRKRTWWPMSGFPAKAYWNAPSVSDATSEEMYMAVGTLNNARIGSLSNILTPGGATYTDPNSSNTITWNVETPYLMGRPGKKTWKAIYPAYDLRNASGGGTDDTMALAYLTSPELTSYTSLGTFAKTTALTRARLRVNKPAHGLGLKLSGGGTTARATDVSIFGLEADVHTRESSRVN